MEGRTENDNRCTAVKARLLICTGAQIYAATGIDHLEMRESPVVSGSPYLNIKEAADYLGISPHTLYKLVERREVPAAKVGGSWRLNRSALDEFLQSQSSVGVPAVLLVEPDEADRGSLEQLIRSRGAPVEAVSGVREALETLEQGFRADLVLLGPSDFEFGPAPFLTGLRRLRAECRFALMVEPGRVSDLGAIMEFGPLIVLRKPVERTELVNVLSLVSGM